MTEATLSLHRYFIQANGMRALFDAALSSGAARGDPAQDTELRVYLDLWYGCLVPVIEGWQELRLSDERIDALLAEGETSGYLASLRRHRNGAFHFQRRYWDERFIEFPMHGSDAVRWVRQLNGELGRWFLHELRSDGGRNVEPPFS